MRRVWILVLAAGIGAAGCGLKGPPIPPDADKPQGALERSGSGVLQFGPQAPKEDPEEQKILDLYGRKTDQTKPGLPRVEESIGIEGLMGETGGAPQAAPENTEHPFDPSVPPRTDTDTGDASASEDAPDTSTTSGGDDASSKNPDAPDDDSGPSSNDDTE